MALLLYDDSNTIDTKVLKYGQKDNVAYIAPMQSVLLWYAAATTMYVMI
jgi:hypothetical protein